MGYQLIFNDGSAGVPKVHKWFWRVSSWHRSGPHNSPATNTLYAIGDKPDFNPDSEVLVMRGGNNAVEVGKYREGVWYIRNSDFNRAWTIGMREYRGDASDLIYATKDCPLSPTEAHALISPECPVLDLAKIQALGHSEPVQYEERARVWRGDDARTRCPHWWWYERKKVWVHAAHKLAFGYAFVPAGGPKPTLPPPPPDRILSVDSLEALEKPEARAVKSVREQVKVWQEALDKSRNEEVAKAIKRELEASFETRIERHTAKKRKTNMIKQTAKTIAQQAAVNAIHTRAVEAASLGLQKAGIPKEVVEAPAFQVALSLALPLLVQGACQYRLLSSNGLPEGVESKLGYAASMATATTGVQLLSPVFSQIVAQVTPFLDQIELPEASGAVERIEEDE